MATAATVVASNSDFNTVVENLHLRFEKMSVTAKRQIQNPPKSKVLMVIDEADPQYIPWVKELLCLPEETIIYIYKIMNGGYNILYFAVPEHIAKMVEMIDGKLHIFTSPRRSYFQTSHTRYMNDPDKASHIRTLFADNAKAERAINVCSST
jgi:hypothetical protein